VEEEQEEEFHINQELEAGHQFCVNFPSPEATPPGRELEDN
jgi:hypothetical protein